MLACGFISDLSFTPYPFHLSDNAPAYLHLHAHECILQLLRRIYVYICIYVSVFYFLPLAVVVACGAVVNVAHVVYVTFLIPTLQRRTFSTINAHLSYTCINCRPAELSGQSDPSPLVEFQSKQCCSQTNLITHLVNVCVCVLVDTHLHMKRAACPASVSAHILLMHRHSSRV